MPCTKMTFAGSALFVAALTASASTQSTPPMSAPAAKPHGGARVRPPDRPGRGHRSRRRPAPRRHRTLQVVQRRDRRGLPAGDRLRAAPAARRHGHHFGNKALKDATLDVEKPEVLVYEKRPDGTFQLNGVEFFVPFTAWTKTEPPTIMGQPLKRADSLGFWYLHVWSESGNPSGLFADWNPNVKC